MSAISKRGIKSNPVKGRPFSLFELLGNKQSSEAIRERYSKALELSKAETIGVFTKKNGYDISRFDKWTDSQKRKLRRYYNIIVGLQQHGVRVKTSAPRDKKKRAKAQRIARHPGLIGKLKHVYVPGHPDYKPRVVIDRRGVAFIRDKYLDTFTVLFRTAALATDDEDIIFGECTRVWNRLFELAGSKRKFSFALLVTGESESYSFGSKIASAQELFDMILYIQEKYPLWQQWLRGITGYFRLPGAKLSQGIGSRSAMHLNDLDEKKTLVRKMRRASPEPRDMFKRRMVKDTANARKLDAAYKRLVLLETSFQGMRDRGEYGYEATYESLKKKQLKVIEDLENKVLARHRFNKRSKK